MASHDQCAHHPHRWHDDCRGLIEKGAGMTAKGRAEYNKKNDANLKAPAPNPKTKADEGRKKSFCARMEGIVKHAKGDAPRAKASLKNWNC